MPTIFEQIDALRQATGWAQLADAKPGPTWHIALEDDLDGDFLPLGDQFCLMRGRVIGLAAGTREREQLISKAASLQIASMRARASVLAYEKNESDESIICFRQVPLSLDKAAFLREVQGWLNDLAFWKTTLGDKEAKPTGPVDFSELFAGLKI
ncbi:MAG: hypothetical protein IJU79_01590 [Desulfovibrionaceae bacterium]|nr:hypothetical protein [Desulfovibrionaceae bacterium]